MFPGRKKEILLVENAALLAIQGEKMTPTTLKFFEVDQKRSVLTVDVDYYQMDLASAVKHARKEEPELFVENGVYLPSWAKAVAYPARAKGFLTHMFQAIFEGKGDDSLNIDFQTKCKTGCINVDMMFVPGSTTNDNMNSLVEIASNALRGIDIVPVYGKVTSNAEAEQMVKERIERANETKSNVLILSRGMAQRSFSIPQITRVFLAYDGGGFAPTVQKMSRVLTPSNEQKTGCIVSLSFDPTRDNKFDAMLIETAQNFKRNRNMGTLKEALGEVIKTVNIFRCQPNGCIKIQPDEYLSYFLESNSIDRIIGQIADLNRLTPEQIKALASGDVNVFHVAPVEAAQMGKTRLNKAKKNGEKNKIDVSVKERARARAMLVTISQNFDIIKYQAGASASIEESFKVIEAEGYTHKIAEEFGVSYEMIKTLYYTGILNRDLIDLKFV
jgi:flavin-binding protein dodecin